MSMWSYTHTWVLTGIAIVALLRARAMARKTPWMGPVGVGQLLIAVFFTVMLVARQVSTAYAGVNALAGLWLLLGIAAVYVLLAVGRRLSVLTQPLEGGTGAFRVGEAITEAHHNELTDRARRYRELRTQLRRLDQGQGDGKATLRTVERELSRLHRWRPPQGSHEAVRPRFPSEVTVVDVALSWGPYTNWWDNARRAAVLAHNIGIPASLLLVVIEVQQDRQGATKFLDQSTSLPDLLWKFVGWQITWASAGLVLGALWRLARALGVAAAFGVLLGLATLANASTDKELGNAALSILLLLVVLTVTSLAMDAETFRSERQFWSSRVGLLASIYQIRGASTQIAYLTGQAVAVVTVLRLLHDLNPGTRR
jgi:hypothetical protein